MSVRLVSVETARLRFVAGVNNTRKCDFHAFVKPERERAAITLSVDVIADPAKILDALSALSPD